MYKILTMNTISPIYKEILPAEEYEVSPTVEIRMPYWCVAQIYTSSPCRKASSA